MALVDVQQVLAQAVGQAQATAVDSVIAVADREGHVLAVWDVNGGAPPDAKAVAAAVSKAGTAAFLSSNLHAFTSRTAGFIIQQHFPPGVENRPNGPLVGVGFSSMAFSDTNKFKAPSPPPANDFPTPPVPGIDDAGSAKPADAFRSVPFTSLAGTPGGVPLFKDGRLVGGIGVVGDGDEAFSGFDISFKPDTDEAVALSGQAGYRPSAAITGDNVLIDGIRLAYVAGAGSDAVAADPATFLAGPGNGLPVVLADIDGIPSPDDGGVDYSPKASPVLPVYPQVAGLMLTDAQGIPGELRSAVRGDPAVTVLTDSEGDPVARLTATEVEEIITLAAQRSLITRAGIRLPRGQIARVWISVVNNPGVAGAEPVVLGTYRTPDATMFSWDVAVQKARTAVFFSRGQERGESRAFSCRSVGFLAQSMYPPGIEDTPPGPLNGLQESFSLGVDGVPLTPPNPNVPNGITVFPGGFPLYRNGVLIGAIGVSGDGIEQDDIIAASGAVGFLPPEGARSDDFAYQNARIPYAKFPRAASSF